MISILTQIWSDLRYRVRSLVRRDDVERELADELRFHLEREADKYESLGMSCDEARRRARIAFGGVEEAKEESRAGRGTLFLETIVQDGRYALRGLRAKPVFTAGIVLTLGMGIGANAAMFGIVDRLLLRPPAYLRNADHVHRVYLNRIIDRIPRTDDNYSFPRYLDLVRWSHDFSELAASASWNIAIGDGESTRVYPVVGASASYFDFFDAPPALGRFFSAREDSVPIGSPVAVLGYGFWQSHFGGRKDVLGRELRVGHTLCTIIGVAPREFHGVEEQRDPAVYIPVTTFGTDARGPRYATNYGFQTFGIIVRRKPQVSIAAANADLTAAFERSWLAQAAAKPQLPPIAAVRPMATVGPVQRARGPEAGSDAKVVIWTGGVALVVLIIACANVANLLLARAISRRREIALRRALGVTASRLVQQLLTESFLLALLGAAAGLMVAQWGGAALRALFLPADFTASTITDRRTLLVATVIALAAALFTGVAPMLEATRSTVSDTLTGAGRDTGFRSTRWRSALLVVQATLSVVLLVGAGLFVRSLDHVRSLRLGYDVDPVLAVTDNSRGVKQTPTQRLALENHLVDVAHTVPGVVAASIASSIPFWGFEGRDLFVAGVDSVSVLGNFDLQAANPDYFRTMGTRLLRGRSFDERDGATAPRVVVVSLGMAQALWPGQDAIGKCIRIASRDSSCASVIGISEGLHLHTLTSRREYMYYVPIAQHGEPEGMLLVRVAGDATAYVESVRRRLQQEMPGASYVTVQPLREIVDPTMRTWQLGATMFVAFGVLALVLAGIGLYSVIAYGVAQRRREIGVRIALGASRQRVVRLVMQGGVRLVAIGIALGAIIALSVGHAMATLLFHESATDPLVYLLVTAVLVVVALAATIAPAVAAARVDPNVALRME